MTSLTMMMMSSVILIWICFVQYLNGASNQDIKYTVMRPLEPWGRQRTEADKEMWDKKVYHQNSPGLRLTFPDTKEVKMIESEIWEIAGWSFRFVQLKKGQTYVLDRSGALNHMTVHRGKLTSNNGEKYVQLMSAPGEIRSTYINNTISLKANEDSIFSVWSLDPELHNDEINSMIPDNFSNKRDVVFRGLYGNVFRWVKFSQYFPDSTNFDDDFYNLRGFEIYDSHGERILYIDFWTAGQGVNCGYHDHQELTPETTFAETHLCLVRGGGGVQWIKEDGTESELLSFHEGDGDGACFHSNKDWTPIRNNGVVSYPTHRWINPGNATMSENAYDMFVVFRYKDITSTAA